MMLCVVCEEVAGRYPCPVCRALSCSVECYRRHRETPCDQKKEDDNDNQEEGKEEGEEEEEEEEERLTEEQLARLKDSEAVRGALRDDALRDVVRRIDSAPNRLKALEDRLTHDPDFASFVDTVLASVTQ